MDHIFTSPAPATSGLVEQQRWFARIRASKQLRNLPQSFGAD
jgi:hypothetical protein